MGGRGRTAGRFRVRPARVGDHHCRGRARTIAAHESQVGDFGPFLAMPAEQVEDAFGQESFRRRGGATSLAGHDIRDRAPALDRP
jgi:hypothetical protein